MKIVYFQGMHKCDNGRCVPNNYVCNGKDDCCDFSDERDCGKHHNILTQSPQYLHCCKISLKKKGFTFRFFFLVLII